jgi:hypothetical protein
MNPSNAQRANATPSLRTVTHQSRVWRCAQCVIRVGVLLLFAPVVRSALSEGGDKVHGVTSREASKVQIQCLPTGNGYLRAKLNGAIAAELNWDNAHLECAGSVRPNDEGVRLRFSHIEPAGTPALVLLFGISGLHEGEAAKALAVNVTIMREGSGEFYSTQGDNKCTIDEIHQQLLSGAPLRKRSYRVEARGFCTQPARALNGNGSVLITRFDFAGRVEFEADGAAADGVTANVTTSRTLPDLND